MRTVLLSPSTVQRSLQTAWAVRSSVCVPRLFPGRAVSARRATTTRAEGDRGAWCACATRAGTLSPLARLSLPRPVAGLVPRMQVHVHPVPDLQEIGGAELQAPAAAVPRHAGGWEPVHGDEEGGEAALGVCEGRHRGRWAAVVHVAGEGAPGLSGLRARRARCAAVRDLPSPRPPQVNFALSASELGKIIDLPLDGSVSFIHSPETGETKTLTLRPLVTARPAISTSALPLPCRCYDAFPALACRLGEALLAAQLPRPPFSQPRAEQRGFYFNFVENRDNEKQEISIAVGDGDFTVFKEVRVGPVGSCFPAVTSKPATAISHAHRDRPSPAARALRHPPPLGLRRPTPPAAPDCRGARLPRSTAEALPAKRHGVSDGHQRRFLPQRRRRAQPAAAPQPRCRLPSRHPAGRTVG